MDKKDLKVGNKYIWRHSSDNSDDMVEEKVELVGLHGRPPFVGQDYDPSARDPLPGGTADPEWVRVKVLATGDLADARACDLRPLP
jgi:hypothetical protein